MATSPGLVPETLPAPPPPRPAGPRVPAWRRLLAAVVGVALVCGAVYTRSIELTPDELNDPLTTSGGMGDALVTGQFTTRAEKVEFARSVRVKRTYSTDDAPTDHIFMIVKVSATAPRRPIQLAAHLVTADGARFDTTDRVETTATFAYKWVQSGWWASGLFFFEIPPARVAGARLVVSVPNTLYGDVYQPETSADLGLDAAGAARLIDAAKDAYEVKGT
ncbi:hypothetical protein Ssi03_33090 [Sphaerisporangium siamense]|uniref:DUF4352 domain-containing protein n=1 Tax=Sphaerisporangium siamense TaxID=795645 RepID=A0A7W7D1R2_9ACTN|nr:hypothetical protein [Sphaerisporangium siamense]MBB4698622.1 hypothetical protein [Sphaerisporangium siamense]GII85319.1 hypothetical protein Ssi03_33090 [Sphaerisporangium siamense]